MQLDLALPAQDSARSVEAARPLGRTFRETRLLPIHRWYSYVEGYSADYLVATLGEFGAGIRNVYDPFGGTGTALLEAAKRGVPSYYAEANPFMAFVIDSKINAAAWARRNLEAARTGLSTYLAELQRDSFRQRAAQHDLSPYHRAFPNRDFFDEAHLRELLEAIRLAGEVLKTEPRLSQLVTLGCAANVVGSSHMTRRADLRRRRVDEYKTRRVDVVESVSASITEILDDLPRLPADMATVEQVAGDCRVVSDDWSERFDAALTSPPYLNGTNYVRNTKLELFVLGFIEHELELGDLRAAGVTGGITQAATSREIAHRFDFVEAIACELDRSARDKRIPHLVRLYFSDMYEVFQAVHAVLRPGGHYVLDIGDSRFYGVHVPTDRVLAELAESVGFRVESERLLARRHSRDKSPLVQVDLRLVK